MIVLVVIAVIGFVLVVVAAALGICKALGVYDPQQRELLEADVEELTHPLGNVVVLGDHREKHRKGNAA